MILALVLVASQCQVLTEAPKPKGYLYRVGVSLNQLLNALTFGDPDETLSSRWGRAKRRGNKVATLACKTLDFVDRCHCELAIEFDDEGNPLPHQLQPRTEDK